MHIGGRAPGEEYVDVHRYPEFYSDPHGTNYARARYLCYYLQEHDLLRKFYRRFRANVASDPTGYNTLILQR